MELKLYIYSGLGNIIALVDLVREDLCISSKEVVKIAESEGVEFDQLISILPPENPDMDLSIEIFNDLIFKSFAYKFLYEKKINKNTNKLFFIYL